MQKNMLIIDNDLESCKVLKQCFTEMGYQIYYCLTGKEGLIHLMKGSFDFLILEIVLAGISGWDILSILNETVTIPVLILSVSDLLEDKVRALDSGADDYMVKPYHVDEVAARVRAIYRRCENAGKREGKNSIIYSNDFIIDFTQKVAFMKGRRLKLSKKEFNLLYYFIINKNQVLSKEQIYNYVWNDEGDNLENSVMCQIYSLRRKIEVNPSEPEYIKTVWGFGYRFDID